MRATTHISWARASLRYPLETTPPWPWRLRVRVWSRRFQLDEQLAAAADPLSGELLTLRARELSAMDERRRIARSLGLVLQRSRQSPRRNTNAVPLDRGAIETVEDELREIHRRLLAPEPVGVQGVALALLMVRDGGSPLYNRMAGTSLRALVARVLRALDEPGADPGAVTEQRLEAPAARGHGRYKIFLGMAAGVGKTYRMLQEGQTEAEAGRDVVIGYLEPHGRAQTIAQAEGLEVVPRRRLTYRETVLEEMDLPGVLARAPELCLIDELAHTNAPGSEHPKRYEDITKVLAAGTDVFSTVNVQHLESLNDQVSELTGIRVRETVPDSVLATADEVVLIDLTPEALIERLRAGKIYSQPRIEPALNNFFRIENLAALREVALRQVAEEVESKRLVREVVGRRDDRLVEAAAPQAVGERLLALVTPQPHSQRVVRRAWRSAQRLGGELDLLWVSRREELPTGEAAEQIDGLRRLASVLGVHLLVEHGDDIVDVVRRVAAERGTTYVLMGVPNRRKGIGRLAEPLPMRLVRALPGIDVRIVADRRLRRRSEEA